MPEEAEHLSYTVLAEGHLTEAGKADLLDLALHVRQEREYEVAGQSLSPESFRVELDGPDVRTGGLTPMDAVVVKLQQFRSLGVRTADWVLGHPFRPGPARARDLGVPLLAPARVGSYAFDLRFESHVQEELPFEGPELRPTLADSFFRILDTAVAGPGELAHVVEDDAYRLLFLKLVRNIAPTGHALDVIAVTRGSAPRATTYLTPEARGPIAETLRATAPVGAPEDRVTGVLRALNLDRRTLRIVGPERTVTCYVERGVALDDEVGPLVNHPVTAVGKFRGDSLRVRDLYEAEDAT